MHKTDFVDEEGNSHPNYERVISELVAMDYIETENDENVFFLTTSGYDCVEELNGKKERIIPERRAIQSENLTEMIHKFGTKKIKKYIFIWLISFGIFVAVYKYFFPSSFQNKKPESEVILTDEMVDDIKEQTQQKTDSIKNK
ncbi:hypothetical protein DZC78_00610 [Olleya aquimaris]|nr:hypothetical protein DZC78_00610 [Olleya aquimaris]